MSRRRALATAAICLALAGCASMTPDDVAASARAAQRAVVAASDAGDCARLRGLIADEFVIRYQPDVGARDWRRSDKPRSVAHWCEKDPAALPTLIDDQTAVVSGDAATVFARITDRARSKDGGELRWVTEVADTFVRRGGRWVLLASQESLVEAPPQGSSSTSQ